MMEDRTPMPENMTLQDQADIMHFFDPNHAYEQRLEDLREDTKIGVTLEKMIATKRGSCSWDRHQVLSWPERRLMMTAQQVTVELRYATLEEACIYADYLLEKGILAGINPG